jgi:hypothetical protein
MFISFVSHGGLLGAHPRLYRRLATSIESASCCSTTLSSSTTS